MEKISRSKQREQAFFLIFEELFGHDSKEAVELYGENVEPLGEWAIDVYNGVCNNKEKLDETISANLDNWKINRIPKVNLAILRLSVYELLFLEDVPDSASINEAVELAKKYSGKKDAAFINGVLGSVEGKK